ncbi:hypothetical protein GM921_11910 [Pedobacter sp. LMG 31464]|uniref:Lipoprotein n=1 Tax=Pedobacter planticolens TaxID=2679964 RepID=A0A923E0V5_9SPHI|nr:hypothetical protein [Pedobacter planticolens]MBB2146195.1 hypothetical protein [Pedobacter planticolens]
MMIINRILVLLLFLAGCTQKQKHSNDAVSMITYSSYGFTFESGKIFEVKNSIDIAYYKDYIVYKTTVISSNAGGTSLNTDVYLNDTTGIKSYQYYFFKKGEKSGLVLTDENKWKVFKQDTFLKLEGLNFNDYDFFKLDLGKPDKTEINPKTKEIEIEKFENKLKGENEPDSLYRYYSKDLSTIDFSFNPEFDARAHSKLYKIGVIHYSTPKSASKSPDRKRRESFWKIEKSNSNESDAFLKLFNRFIAEKERVNKTK